MKDTSAIRAIERRFGAGIAGYKIAALPFDEDAYRVTDLESGSYIDVIARHRRRIRVVAEHDGAACKEG